MTKITVTYEDLLGNIITKSIKIELDALIDSMKESFIHGIQEIDDNIIIDAIKDYIDDPISDYKYETLCYDYYEIAEAIPKVRKAISSFLKEYR